jgi:hypothetical protein
MTTNDANERKPIVEFGRRRGGERPRLPAPGRRVLIFVISMAACGFITWWLWARFRIRFYFIFNPFIGIGGPLLGRLRRNTGTGLTPNHFILPAILEELRRASVP